MTSWEAAVSSARDYARDVIATATRRGWTVAIVNPFGEGEREHDSGGWTVCLRCLHPRWPFSVVLWVEVAEVDGPSAPLESTPFAEVQVGDATPESFGGQGWPQPLLTAQGAAAAIAMIEAHHDGIEPDLLTLWAERLDRDADHGWAADVRALRDLQSADPGLAAPVGVSPEARSAGEAESTALAVARDRVARLETALSLARARVRDLEGRQVGGLPLSG